MVTSGAGNMTISLQGRGVQYVAEALAKSWSA
jgi:hypothetical protein